MSDVWGPSAWRLMHTIAQHYPESADTSTQDAMRTFLSSLQDLLPCTECKQHLRSYLQANPMTDAVQTRSGVQGYLVDLHNDVNRRLNKPVWRVERAVSHYRAAYTEHHQKLQCAGAAFVVGVLLVVGLVYMARRT